MSGEYKGLYKGMALLGAASVVYGLWEFVVTLLRALPWVIVIWILFIAPNC